MGCWTWLWEVLGEVRQYHVINDLDREEPTTAACVLANFYSSFITELKPHSHC